MRPRLKRAINLPLLTLYGLGNIVGAGIYVLIGQVAGVAGYGAPIAFLLAFSVAALTAFSYMELSSRFPKAASVPTYLYQAFGNSWLSAGVGLLLIAAGSVSAATLTRGFVGYFQNILPLPGWVIICGIIGLLTAVALAGISQSVKVAAVLTIIEVFGLVLVVAAGAGQAANFGSLAGNIASADWTLAGLLGGAFIAFYAFIGFEDMVEIAEEVRNPLKTIPRAILLALAIAAIVYLLVVISALLVFTPTELAASQAPLADIFAASSGLPAALFSVIGLTAITGGILVHLVMGSRILYGLANKGWIHGAFAQIHETTRIPATATMVLAAGVIVLSVSLPLVRLAELASLFILVVFALVNASLLIIKKRRGEHGGYVAPRLVPLLGLISTVGMLISAFIYLK